MKSFRAIIRKEFYHVFRDPRTMLMLFGLPVLQILLFGFALSNEVRNIPILIQDFSKDAATAQLVEKFRASPWFTICDPGAISTDIGSEFQKGHIRLALVLPAQFIEKLTPGATVEIQLIADATDPNTATRMIQYASSIIQDFQSEWMNISESQTLIHIETRMIYNEDLSAARNFVPGLIALILLLICVLMTSVSIVREKEKGNMEILLTSPINPLTIVLAKAMPYLVLSLLNLGIILLLSVFLLQIPIAGSLLLLIGESVLLIGTALSLGLLISIVTQTQESAMMISLMGMLLPTLLFTGFMFPLENMPLALQYFANILPSKWYYVIANSIMIKGLGFEAIWKETLILIGMTAVLLLLSIRMFKSRLT